MCMSKKLHTMSVFTMHVSVLGCNLIYVYNISLQAYAHLTHADPDMGRSPGFVVNSKQVLPA